MPGIVNLKFLIELEQKGHKYVVDWLMQNEFIPNKANCPKCGKSMKLSPYKNVSDGYSWKCRIYSLNHFVSRSVRKDTWFYNSHLTLSTILQITYLWIKNCTTMFIMDELHVSSETVTDWKMFCREVCMELCIEENIMLGGPGIIIELIEKEFEIGKNHGQKKREKSRCIYGGIERGTNKLFLKAVPSSEQSILVFIIQENILPGSIIISDCWSKYNYLNNSLLGPEGNQNFVLKNSEANSDVETINEIWNIVEDKLENYAAIREYLDLYLAEYVWQKRHKGDSNIFISFIKAIGEIYKSQSSDGEQKGNEV